SGAPRRGEAWVLDPPVQGDDQEDPHPPELYERAGDEKYRGAPGADPSPAGGIQARSTLPDLDQGDPHRQAEEHIEGRTPQYRLVHRDAEEPQEGESPGV